MDTIRWGILGTGKIASKFAEALVLLSDASLTAVGSRSQEAAEAFGRRYGISRRFGSYAGLAEDPEVDAVYIATPHSLHRDNCMECLRNDKAVLCEKPFAMNAREAGQMIELAREKKLFLMEAMWTRFLPAFERVRNLLAAEELGEIRLVDADFAFRPEFDKSSRLFDPSLGGGALLDLGVYPVSLASLVFGGEPEGILTSASMGTTGVDEQSATILNYPAGRQAVLSCSFLFDSPREAYVVGTRGWIQIHRPWWYADSISIMRVNGEQTTERIAYRGNGYSHEAMEVMRCVRDGCTESNVMPLSETIGIIRTLDAIRGQWGLRYPADDRV